MKRTTLVAAAALAVAILATPAFAETHRFPEDHPSPQAAIDAAGPGDKVIISDSWTGRIDIIGKSGIKIMGKHDPFLDAGLDEEVLHIENCDTVIVSGLRPWNAKGNAVTVQGCTDVILDDLWIGWAKNHGIAVGSSSRVGIRGCLVEYSATDGINLDTGLTGTAPTECVVTKNRVYDSGDDGIDVTGRFNVVSKNRVERCGSSGINLDQDAGETVEATKNRISDCMEFGIRMRSTWGVATKNRIADTDDDGIHVEGDNCTVSKNRVDRAGDDGIDVEGESNLIERNKIKDPGGDGFDADGHANQYVKNVVVGAGDDGMEIESDENLVEKNSFLKCDDHGLVIQKGEGNDKGHRNVITKNKALKNDDDDMWTDWEGDDDNTWEKNKFKTGNVPD